MAVVSSRENREKKYNLWNILSVWYFLSSFVSDYGKEFYNNEKILRFDLPSRRVIRVFNRKTFLSDGRQPEVIWFFLFNMSSFKLLSVFSLVETITLKILDRRMSWHAKCSLPIVARKRRLFKLSRVLNPNCNPSPKFVYLLYNEPAKTYS